MAMTVLGGVLIATIIGISVHSSVGDDRRQLKLLHVVSGAFCGGVASGECAGCGFAGRQTWEKDASQHVSKRSVR